MQKHARNQRLSARPARLLRAFINRACWLALTALLGGLAAMALIRNSPGFGVDLRELDLRLSDSSAEQLRAERFESRGIVRSYVAFLAGAARGDLGVSQSFGQPVAKLLAERLPATLGWIAGGLLVGWALGLGLALVASSTRAVEVDVACTAVSGLFLSLPSGLVALLLLYLEGPVFMAIGLVLFPRIFRFARNLLADASQLPHVVSAYARGLRRLRVLLWHVLPSVAGPLIALAGVSITLAFGASVTIEAIGDYPGVGQLAWEAALARDMPLLVNLTIVVVAITVVSNLISDLAAVAVEARS